MIVTIDGPAGAGKSTVARQLAERLGFRFFDTGAMYRAVALAALDRHVNLEDPHAIAELAAQVQIDLREERVWLDGCDVTDRIRSSQVTSIVHHVADNPDVRARLVELQRIAARDTSLVTEGRDQGSVVFPDAQCKIFLTASAEERARRRASQLDGLGHTIGWQEVLAEQNARDQRDSKRHVGRLVIAEDAREVVTDGMTTQQVVDRLEQLVRERMPP